ncbi:MAG: metallophosphoesterase [Ideonella sp.]
MPSRTTLIRSTGAAGQNRQPLLTFVVVADTHINERDDVSTSPFETNRLANDRARQVFREIAAMDPAPAFVFHLGDIVHPVPSLPTYDDAIARFKDLASPVTVPLHLVPGNHDVGDKRIEWMPADLVCDDYLRKYREAFGADYFCVDQGPLRLLAINSLLLNSGLADEQRQRDWLEQQIGQADGKRVFLFMHYPPYIHSADERGNYDNIDEPGRSWLLAQMRRPEVEAVFTGHVHNFWYDRVGSAEMYMLPSTAFVRHDFSEFYRIAPQVEFGRGDAAKFGYFVVDVFADGHVAHLVRTDGGKAAADSAQSAGRTIHLAHPKTSSFDRVGVELRHPWTERRQISATGGVQEFGRKWARNDYPLLALWEMGVRLAKIPDIDLAEAESSERMALMARLGQRYIVTHIGAPKGTLTPDSAARHGVIACEVNATLANLQRQTERLAEWRKASGLQVFFSKIHSPDESRFDGRHFSHFVKAGLTLDELSDAAAIVRAAIQADAIDGVTVRVEADEPLLDAAQRIIAFQAAVQCEVLVSLKTSGPNLATERADEPEFVARVAQAMVLSKTSRKIRWVFDTFMDVDRGYFPRQAFIDGRFDPRAAARAFTALNARLSFASSWTVQPMAGHIGLSFNANGRAFELLCCDTPSLRAHLQTLPAGTLMLDLVTGEAAAAAQALAALQARDETAALQVVLLQLT